MFDIRYIYTLEHPLTGEIRYIGQTYSPIKRLKGHVKTSNRKTHTQKWIQSLLDLNLIPVMKIVESCTNEKCDDLEIYWIAQFKAWGFRLTNHSDGGKGNKGKNRVSTETRNKIRQGVINSYKNRDSKQIRPPRTQQTKDKISETKRLRNANPPLHYKSKTFTTKRVLDTKTGQIFDSIKQAADSIGMHKNYLGQCLLGKSKNYTNFAFT